MARVKDDSKLAAIQEAALHLVVKTGFTGLKMADVAQEAGIATGTLYIYFSSKEALINDLYLKIKSEMMALFEDIQMDEEDYQQIFREIWMRYFLYCMENPDKMLFAEQFHYSGVIEEEVLLQTEKQVAIIENFLSVGQRKGLLVSGNVHLQKAFIHGAIHEWVKGFVQKRVKPGAETIERCYKMTWSGLSQVLS